MCGIAGIFLHVNRDATVAPDSLTRLRDQLRHRGPDDERVWISPNRKLGLAHTRLAIVDISETGAQPMVSRDNRYVITFNGEIYNHIELRRQLESKGVQFRGTSDTEVLLELFCREGIACLSRLDGMFAFAIYDVLQHELWLARDPLGEKPLYVVERDGIFAFSSEVRALVAGGLASAEADLEGIGYLLRQGSIPPPWTHLRDVKFLPPATWHHVNSSAQRIREVRYWQVPFVPESQAIISRDDALDLLKTTMRRTVALRGRADVPVGVFLSGGVDSAAVCVALKDAGYENVRTFTVSLPGHSADEGHRAKQIAEKLEFQNTVIPSDATLTPGWLDRALADMDVPSIDGPNTWIVSHAAHNAGLKVACSGIGGDELFFGYPTFSIVPRWNDLTQWFKVGTALLRPFSEFSARLAPGQKWSRVVDAMFAGGSLAALWFAKRGLFSTSELRKMLTEAAFAETTKSSPFIRLDALKCPPGLSAERQISFYELAVYMHDQLLRDTDAMSMAHSLELRAPLIARPIVELIASFSSSVQGPVLGKALLRQAIAHRIPSDMLNQQKQGFSLDWNEAYKGRSTKEPRLSAKYFNRLNGEASAPVTHSNVVPRQLVLDALEQALATADAISN